MASRRVTEVPAGAFSSKVAWYVPLENVGTCSFNSEMLILTTAVETRSVSAWELAADSVRTYCTWRSKSTPLSKVITPVLLSIAKVPSWFPAKIWYVTAALVPLSISAATTCSTDRPIDSFSGIDTKYESCEKIGGLSFRSETLMTRRAVEKRG